MSLRFLTQLSLQKKILSIGIGLPALIIAGLLIMYSQEASRNAVESSVDKARSICLTAESAREQTEGQWASGIFGHEQLREWGAEGESGKILSTVPVVTAWKTAMSKSEEGGYEFRVPALEPRNPENAPDAIQKQALEALQNEGLEEYVYVNEAANNVHYFRPVLLAESCLNCHGDPARSEQLWGTTDGTDVTGHRMENWHVGKMHGAFEVVQSLDEANAAANASVFLACILAVSALGGAGLVTMLTLRSVTARIQGASSSIGTAVSGLSQNSRTLEGVAEDTSGKASAMSAAVSQMSANISNVSQAMDQMGSAIEEIAERSSQASGIATKAVDEAQSTREVITRLGESSSRIDDVIKVINSLAEQTNLLALNATIEAARAGESGKGFAVVANEVKELANQTSRATEDITAVIGSIRTDTGTAVDCVEQIHQVISEIHGAQTAIASAVEEQSVTTREIARNIGEISVAGEEISGHIQGVSDSSSRTTQQVHESSRLITDISEVAREVPRLVGIDMSMGDVDGADPRVADVASRNVRQKVQSQIEDRVRTTLPL